MQPTALTADLDPGFDKAFPLACEQIGCRPIDLLGVMMSESGCRPYAWNHGPPGAPPEKQYNAVGLIQFMPDTLRGLGWYQGHEAFSRLSASAQLPFVSAYYRPWQAVGAPWDSAARLYQATFLPGTLKGARAPGDVLAARGGPLGFAYEANAGFDDNGDGKITVGELDDSIRRASHGARFDEILKRLGIWTEPSSPPDGIDVRTPFGLQTALVELGFDVGPYGVDGFVGKDTRIAVAAFQKAHPPLVVDGIPGPRTQAALVVALGELASGPTTPKVARRARKT